MLIAAVVWSTACSRSPESNTRLNSTDGQIYVHIPAGKFMMGCVVDDEECFVTEFPPHEETMPRDFWLGQTEVTNEAYRRFQKSEGGDRQAVVNVTLDEAQAFCRWAGGRVPTEAEWEYAARAGSTGSRYGALDEIAWYRLNSPAELPTVAQKKPNGWGLHDMLGGVWEWTTGVHRPYKQLHTILQDREYREGDRVIRGGHWQSSPEDARASFRLGFAPSERLPTIGFRCVIESR